MSNKPEEIWDYELGKSPRYKFQPCGGTTEEPTHVMVADCMLRQHAATWPYDMAIMIALMYDNTGRTRGWEMADEFMFGVMLGHTHTLLHADQLPKVRKEEVEGGVKLHFTLPSGKEVETTHTYSDVQNSRLGKEVGEKTGLSTSDLPPTDPIH